MEKELDFYFIDNKYYGGNQEWADHYMMRLGGCSTVCACDACIYLSKKFSSLRNLYPFNPFNVTKNNFMQFFKIMYKYVYPGIMGLASILKFEKKLSNYLNTTNTQTKITLFDGNGDVSAAKIWIKEKINHNLPIMYLNLTHRDPEFKDFDWHWFTITGYNEIEADFFIKAATYGEMHILNFYKLWNTGYEQKGGMVCLSPI